MLGQLLFFLYESYSMSIQPVVTKFHNSSPHEKRVTPAFGTQQYLFYFILNNSTKSEVRSPK